MVAVPDADPEPGESPEVIPVRAVPHAVSINAHAKGIVHFIIKILQKNKSVKLEMPLMLKMHACGE